MTEENLRIANQLQKEIKEMESIIHDCNDCTPPYEKLIISRWPNNREPIFIPDTLISISDIRNKAIHRLESLKEEFKKL